MKKVLYITNIEVPYKIRLFNELAKYCDLTVLYERKKSANRDGAWAKSEKKYFGAEYLDGIKVGNEYSFSFRILKYVFSKYDEIVISCFNSPVQIVAIILLRLFHKPYILSIDGEIFVNSKGFKSTIKKNILKGAKAYLAAGEKCANSLKKVIGERTVIPYYFSSLSSEEIEEHALKKVKRSNTVLVVGQYFDYKGLDVAVRVARMDSSRKYKFVGMGKRTDEFISEQNVNELTNVEVIPFLNKEDLEQAYRECAMLLLPSMQECWGLVVNEAASFGTPIVSTWGSGAAVEFLADNYPQYLAEPGDEVELLNIIKNVFAASSEEYSRFLINQARKYSIEECVKAHLKLL